ncbi:MAG: ribonuclease R [Planctomycetes bacterium]|nr:ribonuclease R [Planctomycetota bacterium]
MTTRDKILAHMQSHHYRPMRLRRLARFFDVAEEDYSAFRSLVKQLIREGEIEPVRGHLQLPGERPSEKPARRPGDRTVEGRFSLSQRGFGFVEPADKDGPTAGEDLFIPPGATRDAVTGDTVLAEVQGKGDRGYYGRLLEVKERGHLTFVGTVLETDAGPVVRPDGNILFHDFAVPDAASAGARAKDKVVFEVITYGLRGEPGQAIITEVLGHRGDPGVDTLAVIRQFNLPDEFSEAALDEARGAAGRINEQALAGRRDLSAETIITIDPDDARDYDDAISLTDGPDGAVTLGVHIADVAHFVPLGSPLDAEAYERGTSVYLPTTVVPMLPEMLSNGACSLQEGRTRLTKSVFITFDPDGEPGRVELCNSFIRSTRRLTYGQAQDALDGKTGGLDPGVLDLLRRMDALARRLLERRRGLGYLELDLPEVDLEFNDEGRVVAAHPEDASFTHRIIEMFMIEANEAVARELDGARITCMRRVHPEPDDEASEELQHFAASVGQRLGDATDRRELQRLLNRVRGKPEAYGVHLAVLRSLQKAEYRVERLGHYALGSDAYCHFTSPIRRYPDLTVHRAVEALLAGAGDAGRGGKHRRDRGAEAGTPKLAEAPLEEAAAHCSRTERRAEAAERELTKVKLLEYLQGRVGDTFTGVITGVQEFGVFVENPNLLIDGLVRLASLTDDAYHFDRKRWALVGRRTKKVLRVGTTLDVRIAAVDISKRQLDLVPVEAERKRRPGSDGGTKSKAAAATADAPAAAAERAEAPKAAAKRAEAPKAAAKRAEAPKAAAKRAEAPKAAAKRKDRREGKPQGAGKAKRKAQRGKKGKGK